MVLVVVVVEKDTGLHEVAPDWGFVVAHEVIVEEDHPVQDWL